MADWYYEGPSFTAGAQLGPYTSPLWNFLNTAQTLTQTVAKESGVYTAYSYPTNVDLETADVIYHGGRRTIVDDAEKTLIEASGVGGTFTAV